MTNAAMLAAQAHEISRLETQVRRLEEALAAQKQITSEVLEREAQLKSLLAWAERTQANVILH